MYFKHPVDLELQEKLSVVRCVNKRKLETRQSYTNLCIHQSVKKVLDFGHIILVTECTLYLYHGRSKQGVKGGKRPLNAE